MTAADEVLFIAASPLPDALAGRERSAGA
jgi:hypothetical protein